MNNNNYNVISIVDSLVNILMGKKTELRFKYIQENASNISEFDI